MILVNTNLIVKTLAYLTIWEYIEDHYNLRKADGFSLVWKRIYDIF